MSLHEFSLDKSYKDLLYKYSQNMLFEGLIEQWCQFVPCVYCPRHSSLPNAYENAREDEKAAKYLFPPLELFLCDGLNMEDVLQKLKNCQHGSEICGHVFKGGEPTYTCRDCAVDTTCVLCTSCFQSSCHQDHRYKMNTSGGGGYCDCGDIEAWQSGHVCEIHKQKAVGGGNTSSQGCADSLYPGIEGRARSLFECIMNYVCKILSSVDMMKLPQELSMPETSDKFITMMFNDEVHTYDQVITSLKKALKCNEAKSLEIASTVDREGRMCIYSGEKKLCQRIKEDIENKSSSRQTKPLQVQVMHFGVVAHQTFALKVLSWILKLIVQSDALREIFCKVILSPSADMLSPVERMMLCDTKLWKSARVTSHQLFMAGVLKDMECKKQFAILFCKMYAELAKQYMDDDHDHSVCMISQSVQIFTVPSIAKFLIKEYDLLTILLSAFWKECQNNISEEEAHFKFNKEYSSQNFRRAHFILTDIKYVMSVLPQKEEWDSGLRKSFLKGVEVFCRILLFMQGMDSVKRYVDQHIEYEPEWEDAFNLQLTLRDNIISMLEWCWSDKEVLLETFRITMAKLSDILATGNDAKVPMKVGKNSFECIEYDIASMSVTIHLQLSRFLAGIYIGLSRHEISFQEVHVKEMEKHPKLDVHTLIEQPLRTLSMVAQAHAGMWRRNGFSLIHQIFYYNFVRCRSEMFDRDILMLQVGAAISNPNNFMLHVLCKFNLRNWVKTDYCEPPRGDDIIRQTIFTAEEFLLLLIHIIGERYVEEVGQVTVADVVEREIVHQLCIQPLTHSELAKTLHRDLHQETGIEKYVENVAKFTAMEDGKGKYYVRSQALSRYNHFFYHYNLTEQSKSEEYMKKLKYMDVKPILVPPSPPPFKKCFSSVIGLLDCDVMLYIMNLTLERTLASRSRAWSEGQLERVLHLIVLALYEDERQSNSFNFCVKAQKPEFNLYCLLVRLVQENHVQYESHMNLLNWIVQFFRRLISCKGGDVESNFPALSSISSAAKEAEKFKKAEKARRSRAKVMAKMSKLQKKFLEDNIEHLNDSKDGSEEKALKASLNVEDDEMTASHVQSEFIALGPRQTRLAFSEPLVQTCMVCQEEEVVSHNGRAMVIAAFVQRSTVLSKSRQHVQSSPDDYDALFLPADLSFGVYTSTCGHVIHASCWKEALEALQVKENRLRRHRHLRKLGEFKCPLCETLCNTVLPLIPNLHYLMSSRAPEHGSTLSSPLTSFTAPIASNLTSFTTSITSAAPASLTNLTNSLSSATSAATSSLTSLTCSLTSAASSAASAASLAVSPREDVESEAVKESLLFHNLDLSLSDWLDGIKKTVKGSIQAKHNKENEEEMFLFVPCPLSKISKMMADSVAKNFQLMFLYFDTSEEFSESVIEYLNKFCSDVYSIGLGVVIDESNSRVPLMVWTTCSYTIMTAEQILRNDGKALFSTTSSRQQECLQALIKFAAVANQVIKAELIREHCINLLSALVLERGAQRLVETPCLLDLDLFHLLVCYCFTLPSLYIDESAPSNHQRKRIPTGGLREQHVMHLMTMAHVVQVMLSFVPQIGHESMDVDSVEAERLFKIYSRCLSSAGVTRRKTSPWQLHEYIKSAVLPFLRCSALFFHHLTAVPVPLVLQQDNESGEFEALCKYLALPVNLSELFSVDEPCHGRELLSLLPFLWCQDERITDRLNSSPTALLQYPLAVNQLHPLPTSFSRLINDVSSFTCPKSGTMESQTPTMCLICGAMLCSQSYCCRIRLEGMGSVGAAVAHAATCGAGVGMFLQIRLCQVFLLSSCDRGTFYPAPFVDDYGETDQRLKRGNPLHLHGEMHRRFHQLWLTHAIPSEVSRCQDANGLSHLEWINF